MTAPLGQLVWRSDAGTFAHVIHSLSGFCANQSRDSKEYSSLPLLVPVVDERVIGPLLIAWAVPVSYKLTQRADFTGIRMERFNGFLNRRLLHCSLATSHGYYHRYTPCVSSLVHGRLLSSDKASRSGNSVTAEANEAPRKHDFPQDSPEEDGLVPDIQKRADLQLYCRQQHRARCPLPRSCTRVPIQRYL
ncbi:hypothetical protein RSAG8_10383, partial [Rhizoctonia solani AG-8 WAC10335]